MKILQPTTAQSQSEIIPQIFIGYDERQDKAYEVCRKSILDNASGPVDIYPLNHKDLRRKGLFWREWAIDARTGNYYDMADNLYFSNQFSHTRFLVPEYCAYLGIREQYAMFVDLDFVFFDDVYKLFEGVRRSTAPNYLYVVKHEYDPENKTKMDNQVQTAYPKKLWSSLMVFDVPGIRSLGKLSLDYVNTANTSDLHRLTWIEDQYVGGLSESWNFIPGHSEDRTDKISAIHYTEGLPNLPGYESCKYSKYYLDLERRL